MQGTTGNICNERRARWLLRAQTLNYAEEGVSGEKGPILRCGQSMHFRIRLEELPSSNTMDPSMKFAPPDQESLIHLIIEGVENFWEVWITGRSGDVLAVQRRLCDHFLISRQCAKDMLKQPTLAYPATHKQSAENEARILESLGVTCEVRHVGPEWLNRFAEHDIAESLCAINGGTLAGMFLAPGDTMKYAIFKSNGEIIPIMEFREDGEDSYRFYLACIRFLARRSLIQPGFSIGAFSWQRESTGATPA